MVDWEQPAGPLDLLELRPSHMLRISPIESGNHHAILQLEGTVAGPWVAELKNVCEQVLSEGRPLKLNLADVTFVDQQAALLLLNFRLRGVQLVACSPFVEEQLNTTAEAGPSAALG